MFNVIAITQSLYFILSLFVLFNLVLNTTLTGLFLLAFCICALLAAESLLTIRARIIDVVSDLRLRYRPLTHLCIDRYTLGFGNNRLLNILGYYDTKKDIIRLETLHVANLDTAIHTLFHEIGHWTGQANRMNRNIEGIGIGCLRDNTASNEDKIMYWSEELVAEYFILKSLKYIDQYQDSRAIKKMCYICIKNHINKIRQLDPNTSLSLLKYARNEGKKAAIFVFNS